MPYDSLSRRMVHDMRGADVDAMRRRMVRDLLEEVRANADAAYPQRRHNYYIKAATVPEAVDQHIFSYHLFMVSTTILRRDIESVLLIEEKQSDSVTLTLYTPLSLGQYDRLKGLDAGSASDALEIVVFPTPDQRGRPDIPPYLFIRVCFSEKRTIRDYLDTIGFMQKELVKLLTGGPDVFPWDADKIRKVTTA